jgi:peptide/nickel transport system substrate-binding protein
MPGLHRAATTENGVRRVLERWCFTAVVLLACACAAGCGGARERAAWVDREPLPADTLTVRMREVGRYGGRFVIGATASPKTFNPAMANERPTNDVCGLLYCSLTDIDYMSLEDVPLLARSWEFGEEGRALTFHLRRGARFSDGRPITSADVKFSFDVVMDTSLATSSQSGLTDVDPATGENTAFTYAAPDSYTFVVRSPRPYALMLSATSAVRILPRHVLEPAYRAGRFASAYGIETAPESLVTSGAWRLEAFRPDEKVVLARNPYWFGVDAEGKRLPYLDELVFLLTRDQDAAALKFHAGELDGLDNVRPEDYAAYEKAQQAEKFTLHDIGPSFNTSFLWFNLNPARATTDSTRAGQPMVGAAKYSWFSQRDFRRAVSKAIDREALIAGPFRGYGVKNWSTMSPGNARWYDPAIQGLDHDPDGARALLAGLGWKDRDGDGFLEDREGRTVSFTLLTNSDNNMRKEMLNLVRDDLARVGIKVTAQPVEFNTLTTHMRGDLAYDAVLLGQGSAVPAEPGMGQNTWRSSGLMHYWHIQQERPATPQEARMDALMDAIVHDTHEPARKAAWRELMGIVNDQAWIVWLPTQVIRVPVRSRFGNVQPSPMPHRILWNIDRVFVKRAAAGR